MDGVGVRVTEFDQVYDEKRHAPAVTATITIWLPSRPCICSQPSPDLYTAAAPVVPWKSYVILKTSKTEKVEAQVKRKLESL